MVKQFKPKTKTEVAEREPTVVTREVPLPVRKVSMSCTVLVSSHLIGTASRIFYGVSKQ